MRLADALAQARTLGLQRLDAQLLLLRALARDGVDRAWLLAHDDEALAPPAWALFQTLCRRRQAGEPLAYIVGSKEFHGLELAVDARVLVPRPETELLVDWALDCLQDRTAPLVADLGTGSGAIALALKRRRPDARVWALDTSADALAVARANAQRLGLDIGFVLSDWLATAPDVAFDLIAANPPYVAAGDPHLAALRHEPLAALASGPDGLDAIRRITAEAGGRLAAGGRLLLEHGHDQAPAVRGLLEQAGFCAVATRLDLAGIERCTGGQRPTVK